MAVVRHDIYARLGVRRVVNARGVNTMAGGSLMAPAVLDAMVEAAGSFVDMVELNAQVGACIAELTGADAATVTAGSAAGMLVAAAACMAGTDPARVRQLPDTTGLPDELLIQRCQRFQYDQALRTSGAHLVEAGDADGCTDEQLEAAISERTAALVYVVYPPLGHRGRSVGQMVEIAHRHDLPLIVDAASALPPLRHLRHWTDLGADLVIFSGGKGVRGPAGTGFILGRPDLIAAASANSAPNTAIGRVCKVGKEEIVGLVTALELFLDHDHAAEWQRHLAEARLLARAVADVPGLRARVVEHDDLWPSPATLIRFDQAISGLTPGGVMEMLKRGDPPILVRLYPPNDPDAELCIDPHCLQDGEAELVARRLRQSVERRLIPFPAHRSGATVSSREHLNGASE
ncbi:MAG: aminotransferase class V-fold PLP-dependent enzyme [Chloroflexota bacterium]